MTNEEAIMKIRMDICIERYMCDGCQHEECEYWLAMKALDGLPSAQCDDCPYRYHWLTQAINSNRNGGATA